MEQMKQAIADLQNEISGEHVRELYMRSTSADKKGYGPLIIKGILLSVAGLLLALLVLYGLIKLAKKGYASVRGRVSK